MEKKFYVLFLFFSFSALCRARAQDSTACTAYFYVNYSGSQVWFRAADSITGTQQRWNFGDSTQLGFGSNVGVTHNYAGPGSYLVSLVVRNAATGCYDSSSQVVTISAPPPQCSIGLYYSHDSTTINSPYSFYASPYLAGATSDSVTWTINGSVAGYGNTLNRVLPPGQYTACASLSTNLGCRTQDCQSIFVTDSVSTPPVILPPDTSITIPPIIPPDSNVTVPPDSTGKLPVDTAYWPVLDSLANYLSSYPNPVSGQVHMELKTERAEMIYIRVYNSMGGMIQTVAVSGFQGTNRLSLNASNWQTGIYYIQIQYGNEIKRSRIQKL
jgi:Secretion system C-terminal sorting domain/PKD domain